MKFYKASLIILFLLIISMGVVCAEDANQTTDDTLEITDGDVISQTGNKTYTDLENDIKSTTESIELGCNYTYDKQKDGNLTVFTFNNVKYTIDGNNSYIDANSQAGFIKALNKSDLTIKNLLIKNAGISAIMIGDSKLTLINVTFDNGTDSESGAAVYCEGSTLTITNTKFLNNYAPNGASIFAYKSDVSITDALFKNDDPIHWSIIKGYQTNMSIYNTTFRDTTSKYATAIHNDLKTIIKKSKFINLYANATAGAIAIKSGFEFSNTQIDECEFINVSSAKNGGALFLDTFGVSDGEIGGYVGITNTNFYNCSSEFGGAILQLGGYAEIINSTFTKNTARENGGAIYTSYVELNIAGTNFTANNAGECGGAVYADINFVHISNSIFKDNAAREGGAIYTYDSVYQINSTQFENNGEDIHTYFDKVNSTITNSGNPNKILNATKYVYNVRYSGNPIILNRQNITGSAKDSYFNLRDLGLVTPVRNQGSMGSCWAFGATGAFESAFLIATGISLDVSENNIQNMGLMYSIYGNPKYSEAGTYLTSASYFLSWLGAINTPDDTYDELGKISALSFNPDAYHIVDAIFIDVKDTNAIKEALTQYGALDLFVYGANSNSEYYNKETKSLYYYGNGTGNHYVTLVGWNDTYSKDNFKSTAPGDGAWICKNSWGTAWGDGGYFYLSYYDNSLKNSDVVGFLIQNTDEYEKLYQLEVGGLDKYIYDYDGYEDVFVSDGGDIIAAVGTYFEKANEPYTLSIYINGNLAYTQSGVSNHSGYNTIRLNQYVGVEDKSVFSVRVQSSSIPVLVNTRQHLLTNNTYAVKDNRLLYFDDCIAPIKVYSYHTFLETENIIKYLDNNKTIFKINGADGDTVKISFNGTNQTITLNGTYELDLGVLKVGHYVITITHNNKTYTNHVIVKSTIDAGDVTEATISYNTQLTISVEFVDLNGTGLNKTNIPVKFDGIDYVLPTDEKGMLDIVIYRENSIGTHYLDIVNPVNGESLRITVNIISRFVGNANIDMYYFDGHSYTVRVRGDLGNFVGEGETVNIQIGKKTFKVKTDANGYATLTIPNTITPGTYTIIAGFAGQAVVNTIKVKQVLKLKNAKVKKSAKKLVLKATLKQGSKALKSKKVTFKFNGKKYTAKTNKKGVAKATVKKSVLKKLKVGKKVKYQVTYLKDTVKKSVKVKR